MYSNEDLWVCVALCMRLICSSHVTECETVLQLMYAPMRWLPLLAALGAGQDEGGEGWVQLLEARGRKNEPKVWLIPHHSTPKPVQKL